MHLLKRSALTDLQSSIIPVTSVASDVTFADPTKNKPKLAYYSEDVPRMTLRMGLAIRAPQPFDVDYGPANRAQIAATMDKRGLDFAIAVSDARWGEGKDISDLSVLKEAAAAIEWDGGNIERSQSDPAVDEQIEANRALIEQDRVFGVPFAVYDGQKFWGHDRFDLLVEIASP